MKLLDFGIARSRTDSRLTNAGELFGTPQYMAPERVSSGDAGPNVDLYSLGVMYFEMATGALPFDAPDTATFLIKHLKEPPKRPREVNPEVPPALEELVLQLLEKDPRARPVDAHRVEHDLVAIANALHIPVPLEPIDDEAASQRPPAKTLPNVAVHTWARRVYVFEQMLARGFGQSPPMDLLRMLTEVSGLVQRVTEVRAKAVMEQRKLEEIDKRGREGRQRFGFAVDALGIDASKTKDELRASQGRSAELHERVAKGQARYLVMLREIMVWEGRSGGQEPYPQLSQAYRAGASAVDEWLAWRTEEKRAQSAVENNERMGNDSRVPDPRAPHGARQPREEHRGRARGDREADHRDEPPGRADGGAAPPAGDALLRAAPLQARARAPLPAARVRSRGLTYWFRVGACFLDLSSPPSSPPLAPWGAGARRRPSRRSTAFRWRRSPSRACTTSRRRR